jgi:hypothetical protein
MGIMSGQPEWRPKVIESADLVRGYRAARELQKLSVPPALGKQLANYTLRTGSELMSRDIDVDRLTGDGETRG